jgi:hypothetical protein
MIKMCKNPVAFCSEAVAKFLDIVCTSPQVDCTTELLNQVTGKGLGRRRKRKRRGFCRFF